MALVLDSSAFFSMDNLPDEECFCPSGVIDELNRYKDPRLEYWDGILKVSDPSEDSVNIIVEEAKKTGDYGRLSPVDITVAALGLELGAVVMSDDYSIQNVCARLGIGYRSVGTSGIKKIEKWNYQCVGCKRWFKEKSEECPICGSAMRPHRKK